MKIFSAGLVQETNTFSPAATSAEHFKLVRAADISGNKWCWGDIPPFDLWRERALNDGHDFCFGLTAEAQPSGPVLGCVYKQIRDEILQALATAQGEGEPVGLVLLNLHGAMVADDCDDCEGDFLAHVRAQLGPHCLIAAELDLHCHLTDKMLANADILITYKEYPHTDISDRAEELYLLAIAAAEKTITPTMAQYDCNMVGSYPTTSPLFRQFIDRMQSLEQQKGILSVSFVHGFIHGDVPDMGAKILVVSDNNQGLAATVAQELGESIYHCRGRIGFQRQPMEQALDYALSLAVDKPVVLADQADNVGAGAPGDATFVLGYLLDRFVAMIDQNSNAVINAGLAIFYDPELVTATKAAGEGSIMPMRLGGKLGPDSGQPLVFVGKVLSIRSAYIHCWPQQTGEPVQIPLGDAVGIAILHTDHNQQLQNTGIEVVVSSERCQCFSPQIFTDLGIDYRQKQLLIPKSIQHFFGAFAPVAAEVIYMDTPGALPADVREIPYQRLDTEGRYPWHG